MTILFFSRLFYPHIGGVEKHVYAISQVLLKRGHKVMVITENHGWKNKETIDGIHVHRLDVGNSEKNKKLQIWNELWKLRHIIKSVDLVHCHDVFFWYLPFRYVYSEKPVFTTFHGYEGNRLPTRKAFLVHKLAEKLSNGTICVGDFLKKWYKTNSKYVIYGGVDKKLLQKKSKPNKDIIFIGRLEEETGIIEYLHAVLLLKKKKIKVAIDVYGDGALLERAKSFARDHKINVVFHGFDENVTNYIGNYRYVCTSRYLGILEAMAWRRPVFAEYHDAIKKDYLEMTPFASWVSISKDSQQIASELELVIKGKKTLDMKQSYNWVELQTWEDIVDIYENLWREKLS